MTTESLFQKRKQEAWWYTLKILKLISSGGGFPLIIGAMLLLFYFSYVQFLKWLPTEFPVTLLLVLVYSPIIATKTIRTWMKPADTVFLLPMEERMSNYFRKALSYNFTMQAIRFVFLFSLAYPLIRLRVSDNLAYFGFLCLALILVLWNILLFWFQFRQKSTLSMIQWRLSYLLRLSINFLFLYCLFSTLWVGFIISILVACLLLYRSWRQTPAYPYPWINLIAMEKRLTARYLSIANWFIDLPQESQPVRSRNLLVKILRLFTSKNKDPFTYLYWRSYIRDPELLSMYIRLHIFFAFTMYFLPFLSAQIIVILLGLLLTAMQLNDLDQPNQYPLWVRLYPYPNKHALSHLIMTLLTIQAILLNVIFFAIMSNQTGFILLNIGFDLIVSAGICYVYLPNRQKKLISN